MAVPEGFKITSRNIPKGFKQIVEDPSAGEALLGGIDAAATIAASGLGLAAGGLAGSFAAGSPLLDVTSQEGEQISQDIQAGAADLFDFLPVTEQGRRTIRAIGENETLKQMTDAFNAIGDLNANFGFNLLDPVGKALGIDNLGAIAGTAGKLSPDALLAALSAGVPRLAAAGVKQTARAAEAAGEATGTALQTAGVGGPAGITVKDIFEFQTPAKRKLAELIKSGSTDLETVGFKIIEPAKKPVSPTPAQEVLGVGEPKLIAAPLDEAAVLQGFDKGVLASVKDGTPTDKAKFSEMVDIMERGKKNAEFAAQNRPSDVLGRSLMERFNVVRRANRDAGPKINKVAKSLKGQPVNIEAATTAFADRLAELGIELLPDGKGGFKPGFQNSSVGPGDRAPLKEVLRVMSLKGRGEIDGFTTHEMKRIIDDNVTFGKTKTGIGGRTESALKEFRAGLDEALDSTFPEYNQANIQYSDTIGILDEFQTLIGKKTDLTRPTAEKQVGTLLRRVLSNAQSRVRVLDVAQDIEDVATKYIDIVGPLRIGEAPATAFKDNIIKQVIFADELDRQFGAVARTSFQGQIQQGVEQAAKATTSKAGLADAAIGALAKGVEKARGINDKNAFKAIRDLLSE